MFLAFSYEWKIDLLTKKYENTIGQALGTEYESVRSSPATSLDDPVVGCLGGLGLSLDPATVCCDSRVFLCTLVSSCRMRGGRQYWLPQRDVPEMGFASNEAPGNGRLLGYGYGVGISSRRRERRNGIRNCRRAELGRGEDNMINDNF